LRYVPETDFGNIETYDFSNTVSKANIIRLDAKDLPLCKYKLASADAEGDVTRLTMRRGGRGNMIGIKSHLDIIATEAVEPPQIDTGDTVYHLPTDEHWVVAYVEGNRVAWCGWPEGEAKLSDCTLIEKATPEDRLKTLEQMAVSDSKRGRYARNMLRDMDGAGE